ncbi:DnaA inactivator Hda [Thalassotalea sp. LPB0316]|uniref:DnaA inactivator Hda n=1 Tax=Thalassotalea sp. LPB0316 TaxID=2769490 RepID=UPI001865C53E|nr:DnaA inactivator Hda [Thalassotalea sp. LPB0316]QOL25190.1 DnaA inactivator Hda [Thalassotalea sp. LPB0316]
MKSRSQLTLKVQLPDDETFASFQVGENQSVVNELRSFIEGNSQYQTQAMYLFGPTSVGKSHLLHASCAFAEAQQQSSICMSFSELMSFTPEVLDGLEFYDVICLDDIDLIAGKKDWEQAVFDLFNRVIEQQHKLIICGQQSVKQLNISLPDLVSRLGWGYVESIKALSDDDKVSAIQLRAHQRGLILHLDVAKFLFNRVERDMKSLVSSLDELDKASIRDKRKITIPFIKEVLL